MQRPEQSIDALRCDLKDDSLATAAADGGRPKQVPGLVAYQSVIGVPSVGPFAEPMHGAFGPLSSRGRSELEHDAVAVAVATGGSRAVQIAFGVKHESRSRPAAVSPAGEAVQHTLGKLACSFGELEDGTRAVCA